MAVQPSRSFNPNGRPRGPQPGKRKVAKEQREAALRLAVNGPPPLFEGDSVDYYRRVLSGEIPASEQARSVAADRLLPIDMKLREKRLELEAEMARQARVKAWTAAQKASVPKTGDISPQQPDKAEWLELLRQAEADGTSEDEMARFREQFRRAFPGE